MKPHWRPGAHDWAPETPKRSRGTSRDSLPELLVVSALSGRSVSRTTRKVHYPLLSSPRYEKHNNYKLICNFEVSKFQKTQ